MSLLGIQNVPVTPKKTLVTLVLTSP